MPVEPAGPVSLKLQQLKDLLAASAAWQAWVGRAGNEQVAGEHVYLVDTPRSEDPDGYTLAQHKAMRPFARVDEFELEDKPGGQAWVARRVALGAFTFAGKLILDFVDDVPEEDAGDPVAAKLRFMNNVGLVLLDLLRLGGGDGEGLSIHGVEKYLPFVRSDETELATMGDYFRVQYLVHHDV